MEDNPIVERLKKVAEQLSNPEYRNIAVLQNRILELEQENELLRWNNQMVLADHCLTLKEALAKLPKTYFGKIKYAFCELIDVLIEPIKNLLRERIICKK
jgi:hypothetical protein